MPPDAQGASARNRFRQTCKKKASEPEGSEAGYSHYSHSAIGATAQKLVNIKTSSQRRNQPGRSGLRSRTALARGVNRTSLTFILRAKQGRRFYSRLLRAARVLARMRGIPHAPMNTFFQPCVRKWIEASLPIRIMKD